MCDMKNINAILCVLLALLAFSGCRDPRSGTLVPRPIEEKIKVNSAEDLRRAIFRAGISRGWTMTDEAPGVISAKFIKRDRYVISTRIQYGTDGYSISYVDSQNMDYSDQDGKLSRKYTQWVNNLAKDIHEEILRNDALDYRLNNK